MPAYNAGRWIRDAIEHILAQTYGDFELVISDNASTDDTVEIARSYADPRIRIEPQAKRISPTANHNRSILLSTGEFVKFAHADDMLLPTCVEEMVAPLMEDPQIGLVPRRERSSSKIVTARAISNGVEATLVCMSDSQGWGR